MTSRRNSLRLWWRIVGIVLSVVVDECFGLNTDGIILLSFKSSILSDPLRVLQSWNYYDETPCSWNGVTCGVPGIPITFSRVTGLSLPDSHLLGSIPADLGMIEHLQNLDLSNNSLNGSLSSSLFNATQLRFLYLSNNMISGVLPETVGRLQNLELLNVSDNALAGTLPANLTALRNLTVVSLKNNYFFGGLPSGFENVRVLDLSSNLINGSLPQDFGGISLGYFNISRNRLSGPIPPAFATKIPGNATIDLSFNNLTGEIPDSSLFLNQKTSSFDGNSNLCGEPTRNPCPIPPLPAPTSAPAVAVIPKTVISSPETNNSSGSATGSQQQTRLRPGTIVGIVIGDFAGLVILGAIFFYVYHLKQKKNDQIKKVEASIGKDSWSTSSSEPRGFTRCSCLRKGVENEDESDSISFDTETEDPKNLDSSQRRRQQQQQEQEQRRGGTLVTVDGGKELELETLLKASAYILGATGSSIMYKAVLDDGTTLAIRRMGENHVERFKDFENQVRVIARLAHPNLVRIRGFYWGVGEKLVVYEFVPNGSLANARYRKAGSSPCRLPWEARVKIAKGVARGLLFLHEKKHVHGNLKPSNVLLGPDMEPRIGDFGLENLLRGDTSSKTGGSARNFGSKRSTASKDSLRDYSLGPSPSPSSIGCLSPYQAPESLRSIKPHPKWDVYAFGIIWLELLTGKVIDVDEPGQGNDGLAGEDKTRALRTADVAIRADVEANEESLLACFKLGYSCASPAPQKRPTMKEVLQVLDKIPSSAYVSGR